MTSTNHRVLVVEDDQATREELTEVVHSLGFDVVVCDNKQTALRYINEQAFCMALVDLQILAEPGSIRPAEAHGHTLVREIREKYPERNGTTDWRFPVLVVSGFAREGSESKEVIREGASDIVWKLPHGRLAIELAHKIQELLRASGREDHADCCSAPLELSIPGDRERRKTKVMLGARSTFLADRHLRVLLHLIKGKLTGAQVHNKDMDFHGEGGNKAPSELNQALRATLPGDVTAIVENHYHGHYSLIDGVEIGAIDYDRLIGLDDATISSLAGEIQTLRSRSDRNS